MNNPDFYVGELCEVTTVNNTAAMSACDNECCDPSTGADDCHCEDF